MVRDLDFRSRQWFPSPSGPTTLTSMPATLPAAIEAHRTGNLARAESLYLDLIESNQTHPDPKNLLGVLYRQQSRFQEAIPLIQSAIALSPKTADYHFNLAEALRQQMALSTNGLSTKRHERTRSRRPSRKSRENNNRKSFHLLTVHRPNWPQPLRLNLPPSSSL